MWGLIIGIIAIDLLLLLWYTKEKRKSEDLNDKEFLRRCFNKQSAKK
jgi:hypothetical protein